MPDIRGTILKKVLPIIYVIDTSGSMSGARIASVNEAMHECGKILLENSTEIPDAEIKIGAVTFSSGAKWVTERSLATVEDFHWNEIGASGVTDLGAALYALDDKLSRSKLLVSDTGFCVPVIIFMSDGYPTDDWKEALEKVSTENKWFARAKKIAIAIGDGADKDVLSELVGNSKSVVTVNDLEMLKKLIVAVSCSASMMASRSRMTCNEADGASILDNAIGYLNSNVEIYQTSYQENTYSNDAFSSEDTWDDEDWK